MTDLAGRLRAFAYVNADKAALYRAVMHVFMDAKARFTLHLRPEEVATAVAAAGLPEPADTAAVEAALGQLRDWGNLEAHPDTADVSTVEEFYRSRYLFQLTPQGEAAERALAVYEDTLRQRGELQSAALSDIRTLLGELAGDGVGPARAAHGGRGSGAGRGPQHEGHGHEGDAMRRRTLPWLAVALLLLSTASAATSTVLLAVEGMT